VSIQITQCKSVAEFLLLTFDQRYAKNPSYSYRAFARDIGVSRSQLSEILKGRCGLSFTSSKKVAEKLKMTDEELAYFFALSERQFARNNSKKGRAENHIATAVHRSNTVTIDLDSFRVISDWHHFAILELSLLDSFKFDIEWMAQKLGCEVAKIEEAVERLVRMGMAKIEDGRFQTSDAMHVGDQRSSIAIQQFHRQVLDKAVVAIEDQTFDQRYLSSFFIALQEEEVPKAKKMITDFLDKFASTFDGTAGKTQLYSLGLQFFDLLPGNRRIDA